MCLAGRIRKRSDNFITGRLCRPQKNRQDTFRIRRMYPVFLFYRVRLYRAKTLRGVAHYAHKEDGCRGNRAPARESGLPDSLFCGDKRSGMHRLWRISSALPSFICRIVHGSGHGGGFRRRHHSCQEDADSGSQGKLVEKKKKTGNGYRTGAADPDLKTFFRCSKPRKETEILEVVKCIH